MRIQNTTTYYLAPYTMNPPARCKLNIYGTFSNTKATTWLLRYIDDQQPLHLL